MNTYSYSKIQRYYNCPLSYMRKYLSNEKTSSHGITEIGLMMHNIMEQYEKGNIKEQDLLNTFEASFITDVKSTTNLKMSENFSKDMRDLYYTGCRNYFEKFDGIPNCKEILDVEWEFEEQYNDYLINGKVDLVFINNQDELCILDHKSKNKFKSKKEQREYARQLYVYSYFVEKKYHKYPKWLVFNMFRGNEVYIEFNINDMYEALKWFDKAVNQIENEIIFESNPDNVFCWNWCGLNKTYLCEKDEG